MSTLAMLQLQLQLQLLLLTLEKVAVLLAVLLAALELINERAHTGHRFVGGACSPAGGFGLQDTGRA